MDRIDDELLEVLEDSLPKTAHRETPKSNTFYLSRAAGKSKLIFENALKLDKNKIIYYVNKQYGDRYIVPKEKYESLAKGIKALELIILKCVNVNSIIGIMELASILNLSIDAQVARYNNSLYHGMAQLSKDEYLTIIEYIEKRREGDDN